MAAFTSKDPTDKEASDAHWAKIMGSDAMIKKTILYGEKVAGHIIQFHCDEKPEITYWLDRAVWGNGVATAAVELFLEGVPERPLFARASLDNVASIRVLEKCGFAIISQERGFANARGKEIDEVVMERRA